MKTSDVAAQRDEATGAIDEAGNAGGVEEAAALGSAAVAKALLYVGDAIREVPLELAEAEPDEGVPGLQFSQISRLGERYTHMIRDFAADFAARAAGPADDADDAEPDDDIRRLRDGMAELGYRLGRNPDGDDDTVDATLLIVRELEGQVWTGRARGPSELGSVEDYALPRCALACPCGDPVGGRPCSPEKPCTYASDKLESEWKIVPLAPGPTVRGPHEGATSQEIAGYFAARLLQAVLDGEGTTGAVTLTPMGVYARFNYAAAEFVVTVKEVSR